MHLIRRHCRKIQFGNDFIKYRKNANDWHTICAALNNAKKNRAKVLLFFLFVVKFVKLGRCGVSNYVDCVHPPPNIWQCLETCLVIFGPGGWRKVLGGGPAAGSQWQKLGIFLITQQYTGQTLCPTHQRILQSRLSVIPPWDTLVAMAFISSYRILLVVPFWTS